MFLIGNGQVLTKVKNQPKIYTIPFSLTDYNNISVEAILNKTDTLHLMFHTAASSVTLTEESIKKFKTIFFKETMDSVKSWGSQSNSSRLSMENSIQIGEMVWEKVPIWENINSGQYTDGKFGPDFFKDLIIEIDFDSKVLRIYTILPAKVENYDKLKLTYEDGLLFIEAVCSIRDSSFQNRYLIHSGFSGAILFDDKFADENKLGEKLPIVAEKSLKDSYGNVVKNKQAILPLFKIQNKTLANVPVGFFEGSIGRQKMSMIGGDIIKRFNLIIDAKREFIYLKTNLLTDTEYKKI